MPILTASASYAVAEAFGWRRGLDEKPIRARRFYLLIAASTAVGLAVNLVGINPIDALYWTAVLNGFLAPPVLVLIMVLANDRSVMGRRVNDRRTSFLGWATVLLMGLVALGWAALTVLG